MRAYIKVPALLLALHFVCLPGASQVNSSIPHDWKKVNANDIFTFHLPPSIKRAEEVRGIDSYVEGYRGEGIRIYFDYGAYSNRLLSDSDKPNYRRMETRIGGKRARIVTFMIGELKYFVGVHFPERLRWSFTLTMWAECQRPIEQDSEEDISLD